VTSLRDNRDSVVAVATVASPAGGGGGAAAQRRGRATTGPPGRDRSETGDRQQLSVGGVGGMMDHGRPGRQALHWSRRRRDRLMEKASTEQFTRRPPIMSQAAFYLTHFQVTLSKSIMTLCSCKIPQHYWLQNKML